MNQKLIIEAYKSIEYKGGEKLGSITVQINPDSYKLSKSTSYKKDEDRKSTRLNSSHSQQSRMPSSA